MCGIFGIVYYETKYVSSNKLKSWSDDLFKLSESRGKEASGIAFLRNDKLKIYKEPIRSQNFIKLPSYLGLFKDGDHNIPLAFIGHSRLVTNGLQLENRNNQPVTNEYGTIIHNGIIVNESYIWKSLIKKRPRFGVDTESLLELISRYIKNRDGIELAISKTYTKIIGSATIALFLRKFSELILATNTGSLYFTKVSGYGLFVFASEKYILKAFLGRNSLQGKIFNLKPNWGLRVNLKEPKYHSFNLNHRLVSSKSENKNIFSIEEIPARGIAEKEVYTIYSVKNDINKLKKHNFDYEKIYQLKRCTHCILPSTMPFVNFDKDGICNYCRRYKKIHYKGRESLEKFIAEYRKSYGPNCVVAFSGGRDSSYGLHFIKRELNLNPVAYTYDWGMVTDLARRNQARLIGKLGVEHIIVSADITLKRNNIRKNILAWLKKPDLGMIPLFTVGDKQAEYYIDQVAKRSGVKLMIYCSGCELENDDFKASYSGVREGSPGGILHNLSFGGKIKMLSYYGRQFLTNPAYLNNSITDSVFAYFSTYIKKHDYVYFWDYIPWKEDIIISTLTNEYGWEKDPNTSLTWRTDDGTPAFYNYIYYQVQGFTENDALRSNQIREGDLTRKKALNLVNEENKPRYEALKWYFDMLGLDGDKVLTVVDEMPKLY